jgi:DNA repair exonuclease SbcCD ATPase subunit
MERPLKPNKQDAAFLHESINKFLDALNTVVQKEMAQGVLDTTPSSKRVPHQIKLPWATSDTNSVGSNHSGAPSSSKRRETMLLECISKQDAILSAVTKQTQQQTILNKVTVLTQAITGYQQEISSLRSTVNDTENRILTVEMRIAEAPESEQRLSLIVAKQQLAKDQAEAKLKELQQLISEARQKIEGHTNELDELEDADDSPSKSRKRKFEGVEQDGADGVDQEGTQV